MAIPFFSTFSYSYSIFRKRSCRNDLFYYTMIAPMIEAGQPKKGVWYAFLLEQNRWLVLTVVLPAKTKLNKVQGFHDWIGNDRRKTRHKNMSPDNTRKATPISAFLFLRVLVGYHWLESCKNDSPLTGSSFYLNRLEQPDKLIKAYLA